ncbi:MAG: prepilin-type N-terminal cleavage/methylation domain-containing protein [Planctomycetes bacterium]|jgi:prepilin-type N-terminal cleavage/methylation domain-containing protein|nr:prepilin-type N-terminal cleavage/methylation domain-containing protein [Planctomycetota bacterium]
MKRLPGNRWSCGATYRPSRPGVGGFTLTELLVSMSIVALLLGLLLPHLLRARRSPQAVKLQAELRSIAIAMLEYTQDHDGAFPKVPATKLTESTQRVRKALEPYLKDEELLRKLDEMGWRYTIDPKCSLSSVKLDQIRNPSRVPIGGEQISGLRSQGKLQVIFADGHVGPMTQEEFYMAIRSPIAEGRIAGQVTIDDVNNVIRFQ